MNEKKEEKKKQDLENQQFSAIFVYSSSSIKERQNQSIVLSYSFKTAKIHNHFPRYFSIIFLECGMIKIMIKKNNKKLIVYFGLKAWLTPMNQKL